MITTNETVDFLKKKLAHQGSFFEFLGQGPTLYPVIWGYTLNTNHLAELICRTNGTHKEEGLWVTFRASGRFITAYWVHASRENRQTIGPTSTGVMGPKACSAWRTWLFIFSAFCLLLWPFSNGLPVSTSPSWSQELRGKVLVVQPEAWRRCGGVALDPKDGMWSCCGFHYPFHRGSQRCCSTDMKAFWVIPKDDSKSEYNDCRKYNRRDL